MEFMAERVLAVMDYLEIETAFLVGHSMGGYVALAFLELFQERLTGLCLFHSQPFADAPETIEKRKREISLVLDGKKDVICNVNIPNAFAIDNQEIFANEIDFAKEIARNTSDAGVIASLNGLMQRKDRSQLLAETTLPFLWILGKKDNYIPHDIIVGKVKLPANSKMILLRKSGHQGFMEEMKSSANALLNFLLNLK
jgi:pimeloyl-ACP methyl ester carboxylesterase